MSPAANPTHNIDHNLISTKTPDQIAMMREAGKICAQILSELTPHVKPGVTSQQINDITYDLIVNKYDAQVDREDLSGYDSSAIPLKTGDLFGVDVSIKKEGWCGDTQRMWIVGQETSARARLLFEVGYQAMCLGISLMRPGAHLQTIAEEVQAYVESFGFSMLRVSGGTGHSIGRAHADGWLIPYYRDPRNEGRVLEKDMVITVEPFICAGSGEGIRLSDNTRSGVTADNSLAVYWEHVVAVTDTGCEVLDLRDGEDVTFYDHRLPAGL